MESQVKTVRGLERSLRVLAALQEAGPQSLDELHRRCGLAKATLLRLLKTLHEQGWANRRLADARWYANPAPLMRAHASGLPNSRLTQAAAPVLAELCRKVIWPSDLSVRVGSHMELTETSRSYSHLTLARITVGFPIDMLRSAPGRAYRAFCRDEERNEILATLQASDSPSESLASNRSFISRLIEESREQGYGARERSCGGHISLPLSRYDDGVNTIAVSIQREGRVLGCINIVWIRTFLDQAEMARRHLGDLETAVERIADAFA
ncbi:MAG: helix-turn-helix domain-containing protein [Rhizobiales bacterium]|nr:helix-turn-helix domain-containing protein [Hyphomicrobiales bacterium]